MSPRCFLQIQHRLYVTDKALSFSVAGVSDVVVVVKCLCTDQPEYLIQLVGCHIRFDLLQLPRPLRHYMDAIQ